MVDTAMPPFQLAERFALLLALALFLGLAFEKPRRGGLCEIGFGGIARTRRPAAILVALAMLGLAAAAVYLV